MIHFTRDERYKCKGDVNERYECKGDVNEMYDTFHTQ